jgi:hypothetical protein
MKLFNIFKKETKKSTKSNIQKLEKNQLSKVIGGGGPDIPEETEGGVVKSKSNIRNN